VINMGPGEQRSGRGEVFVCYGCDGTCVLAC
jgi:hypothetical protein